jgi:transcription termination/antitermination protein NusG
MTEFEDTWKVIYVASRFEKKVAEGLEKAQITHYLPLVEKTKVWSDRKKKVQVPLFNSYVFVKPNTIQRDLVLLLPGVVKYLRYNNKDAVVKDAELYLIKNLLEKGYDISENSETLNIQAGERIQITQGPLKDYKGEIIRVENEHFVLINFDQLNGSYKVKLPKQILKRIEG